MSEFGRREFVRTVLMASGGILTTAQAFSKGLAEPIQGSGSGGAILNDAGDERVWACWVGHSTVLIKLGELWLLTDPVFADVVGLNILGLRIGPRRILPPAIGLDEIPKPDIVLLSHAHMDHTDRWTLEKLTTMWPNQIAVLSALNTTDVINDLPWLSCQEIDWGESTSISGVAIRALEVRHNGGRFPGERCRSNGYKRTGRSYNGYEIEYEGARIVFGGDTAYTDAFRNVRSEVDLAIMPIGSYEGYPAFHCNPEEALAMSMMMCARAVMPIHHLTFRQSPEPIREPLARLLRAADTNRLHVAAKLPGNTYRYTA
jgi:L-ascorbate metabolism protein UlaG (beta-lactamase superfamily)